MFCLFTLFLEVDIETKNVDNSPKSPSTIETETAVSFDVPVQPETLLVHSKVITIK